MTDNMTDNMDNMHNISFNFTANPEEMSVDETVAVYKDVRDGFLYPISDVHISAENFEKFVDSIHTNLCEITGYDYGKSKNQNFKKHNGEEIRIYSRGNSVDLIVSFVCKDEDTLQKVWNIFNTFTKVEEEVCILMTSYFMNNGQLDGSNNTLESSELTYLSKKYYPYIDTDILFDQFFTGSENILLLVGNPGLGKSKMSTLAIKHAHDNPDKLPYDKIEGNPSLEQQYISIAYVKSTDVLVNDKFWRELERVQPDICIIDDLDYMLTKRDAEVASSDDKEKNVFLNQFLSFTDGVEKNSTKFIITTNQTYADIDAAVLRKGRLFDILELRALSQLEALDIWKDNELPEDKFYTLFKTDNIVPAELGSEINKLLNNRISTASESYLKEDGISKVEAASRVKKVGLS